MGSGGIQLRGFTGKANVDKMALEILAVPLAFPSASAVWGLPGMAAVAEVTDRRRPNGEAT